MERLCLTEKSSEFLLAMYRTLYISCIEGKGKQMCRQTLNQNRKSETKKKKKKPHRSGFALDTLTERRDKTKKKEFSACPCLQKRNPPT